MKKIVPYVATFNKDGSYTVEPDTPETRADVEQTLHDFHSGRFENCHPVFPADDVK